MAVCSAHSEPRTDAYLEMMYFKKKKFRVEMREAVDFCQYHLR